MGILELVCPDVGAEAEGVRGEKVFRSLHCCLRLLGRHLPDALAKELRDSRKTSQSSPTQLSVFFTAAWSCLERECEQSETWDHNKYVQGLPPSRESSA